MSYFLRLPSKRSHCFIVQHPFNFFLFADLKSDVLFNIIDRIAVGHTTDFEHVKDWCICSTISGCDNNSCSIRTMVSSLTDRWQTEGRAGTCRRWKRNRHDPQPYEWFRGLPAILVDLSEPIQGDIEKPSNYWSFCESTLHENASRFETPFSSTRNCWQGWRCSAATGRAVVAVTTVAGRADVAPLGQSPGRCRRRWTPPRPAKSPTRPSTGHRLRRGCPGRARSKVKVGILAIFVGFQFEIRRRLNPLIGPSWAMCAWLGSGGGARVHCGLHARQPLPPASRAEGARGRRHGSTSVGPTVDSYGPPPESSEA